jgi:acetyl-CoA synthetase
MILPVSDDYRRLRAEFRWPVPDSHNIAADICRWADGNGREALVFAEEDGTARRYSFDDLPRLSSRFANVLAADDFRQGDRLAVFLSQSPEIAVGHLAGFKAGVITMPLFVLFGEEVLLFRLADSGAKGVVTDPAGAAKTLSLRDRLPPARTHLGVVRQ